MKEYSYYQDAGEYPKRPTQPRISSTATATQIRAHADLVEQWEKDMLEYRKMKDAYDQRKSDLEEQFKQDALEEVGLKGHPKADKIYAYAWREGHAHGFSDVFSVLSDIAELFLD